MNFRFSSKKLEKLYTEEENSEKFPDPVVKAFFRVMSFIVAAANEQDLYAIKGLRFEKLLGDRKGQHSLRLNRQWRLIVKIEQEAEDKYLLIIEIVDYH